MSFKCVAFLLLAAATGCLGQGPISCPYGLTRTPLPPGAVFEDNVTTYGDLECVNYCFPTNLIPEVAVSGAEYCGRVFRDIGVNPIATWVLNNTRSNDTADYLTFFVTAESIINNFNTLGFTDLTIASFCVDAALTLLCRYVYPTCDPAFRVPTYDPICRRGCYTLEDFLCKDFFIGLRIAIAGNLLDVSTIDPPLCDPLEDTEGGGAPMCINTLDGDEMPQATQTGGTCYRGRGRGYNGTVSTTASGKTCQRWVSGEPHQFLLPPTQYLELAGGHNYCRNPGSRGQRPWCFTTDQNTRWEYCNVPACSAGPQCELYSDTGKCRLYGSIGYDYIYTDTSQNTEQELEQFVARWETTLMGQPGATPRCVGLIMDFVCHFYFPSCDLSKPTPEPVQACREFCEDIDTSGECASLYQQVVTFAGQFGTLLVPDCSTLPSKTSLTSQCYTNISEFSAMTSSNEAPSDCYLASDNGLTYTGTVNVTASGLPCMSWDLQLPFDVRPINSLLRRDLIGHNYCRNPEQRSDQPWCYASTSSGIVPENCAVAACVAPSPQTALPTYAIIVIAVIGGIIVALVIAISFVICCICCQKKKTKGYPLMDASGEYRLKSLDRPVTAMDMNNDHYVATNGPGGGVLIPTQYEGIELPQFPRDDIVYIRDLGQGNFGLVVQAEARGITKEEESTTVAVKVLKEGAGLQAKQEFFKEASLMHEFVHPNILRLLGVCIEQEPLCMIFEYMELGDLNNFLRKNDPRKMSGSKQNLASGILPPSAVGTEQQVNMAVDISAGLEYLSSHHYVHRDMASRNCLVSGKLRVKIADFGLSQDVYSSDYYRLGESSLLPVRWMPPEAIIYGKFTLQSDIWSFGVVMWELFSYGQQPYFSMTNEEVCQYVRAGQVLPCPDSCPQEIYDLMLDCWAMEPSDRPTASELHTGLRRWNPDISASLSLQRNVAKQPDYQNFAVVKEYEKDGSSRSNTITASTSETVPILPNKRRSYTTSEGAPVSPTTNGGFMKNPGAVEDEV